MKDYSCQQLIDDVAGTQDNSIGLDDSQLIQVAVAATTELRRRMPRYAFEQGDLDFGDAGSVAQMKTAEGACEAVEELQEAWGVSTT
jgi:hypothetical protein